MAPAPMITYRFVMGPTSFVITQKLPEEHRLLRDEGGRGGGLNGRTRLATFTLSIR
ncbi:hypothetical protein GCM10022223_40640 [Kineosporia mesophila]|uniref:Uncharacterized protein n=1 Tax=Kineosporia mesophila TaxID=566012 RepID=A0ABP6ZWD1_9ACTN